MAVTRSRKRAADEAMLASRRSKLQRIVKKTMDKTIAPSANINKKTTVARRPPESIHGMRTRRHLRIFRFNELPPEIRNIIYPLAYGGPRVDIAKLKLPRSICVPGLFSEGLPFFFESTPIIVITRSNLCVRYQHLHTAQHVGFEKTGQINVPKLLQGKLIQGKLVEEVVRFKDVSVEGFCCCCTDSRCIARIGVEVVPEKEGDTGGLKAVVNSKEVVHRVSSDKLVVDVLDRMLAAAEKYVKQINAREGFNGLTVEDLKALALCFRDYSESDDEHASDTG